MILAFRIWSQQFAGPNGKAFLETGHTDVTAQRSVAHYQYGHTVYNVSAIMLFGNTSLSEF